MHLHNDQQTCGATTKVRIDVDCWKDRLDAAGLRFVKKTGEVRFFQSDTGLPPKLNTRDPSLVLSFLWLARMICYASMRDDPRNAGFTSFEVILPVLAVGALTIPMNNCFPCPALFVRALFPWYSKQVASPFCTRNSRMKVKV